MYTVYLIRHVDPTKPSCYVGFTSNLYARKSVHKSLTNNPGMNNGPLYQYLTQYKWSDFICHPIQEVGTKAEAMRIEEEWRVKLSPHALNTNKSGGCSSDRGEYFKQWRKDHEEYDHIRYEKNKEKIARRNAGKALWKFMLAREELFEK